VQKQNGNVMLAIKQFFGQLKLTGTSTPGLSQKFKYIAISDAFG